MIRFPAGLKTRCSLCDFMLPVKNETPGSSVQFCLFFFLVFFFSEVKKKKWILRRIGMKINRTREGKFLFREPNAAEGKISLRPPAGNDKKKKRKRRKKNNKNKNRSFLLKPASKKRVIFS